jgi:hypothetical protein
MNINKNNTDEVISSHKKRGRKPKAQIVDPIMEPVEVIKKKRGRKPKGKIINYAKEMNTLSSDAIYNNIVTNLPIKLSDIDDNNELNDSNIFIQNTEPVSLSTLFTLSDSDKCNHGDNAKYIDKINELQNVVKNLSALLNENKKREVVKMDINFVSMDNLDYVLAEKTSICCWWCCHQFDTPPCVLPDKFYCDVYYVYGCFCSYNCSLAYNIDINDYKTNERTTLLNNLHSEIFKNNVTLKPSPPRQSLKMFGGTLSIDTFRESLLINKKEYRYILPPMMSIIPLIEEDYNEINKNAKLSKFIISNDKKLKK